MVIRLNICFGSMKLLKSYESNTITTNCMLCLIYICFHPTFSIRPFRAVSQCSIESKHNIERLFESMVLFIAFDVFVVFPQFRNKNAKSVWIRCRRQTAERTIAIDFFSLSSVLRATSKGSASVYCLLSCCGYVSEQLIPYLASHAN